MSGTRHNPPAMYCHGCHNEWQQSGDDIDCPACSSLSTEIVCECPQHQQHMLPAQPLTLHQITPENDPRQFHNRQPTQLGAHDAGSGSTATTAASSPPHVPATAPPDSASGPTPAPAPGPIPAASSGNTHGPSEPNTASNQHQDTANAANSETNGPARGSVPQFFIFPPAVTFFTTVVTDPAHPQPAPTTQQPITFFGMQFFPLGQNIGTGPQPSSSPASAPNASQAGPDAAAGTNQTQQTGQQPENQPRPAAFAHPHMAAGFMAALMSSLFNQAGSVLGDAVYSQEALDRIITQLREAHSQAGGAPPASQSAIDKLQVKEVDEKMLGADVNARCVICVDDMAVGEKAAVLPCNHFFHSECVTPWLKQHNTCPVCRKPIEEEVKAAKGGETTQQETPRYEAPSAESCP
ncbi:hypothetical protein B0T22DRAFT_274688 [Podospora appendiculata]|uniref:RING-type E3 ubiquitin transferase n=1 Tax=Podospora appendiculata TaxID=314037 RepID=A0AAE0X3Z2_9PEZI|nr:hypothetical protein B0T22DRAFT_274688 [Podospora appendiculata]